MKRFTINLISLKVEETHNPIGLNLNKIGMVYGFTIESVDIVTATDLLNSIEERWREWIVKYNLWITNQK